MIISVKNVEKLLNNSGRYRIGITRSPVSVAPKNLVNRSTTRQELVTRFILVLERMIKDGKKSYKKSKKNTLVDMASKSDKNNKTRSNKVPQKKDLELREIEPKSDKQSEAFRKFQAGKNLVLHGSAGTGKTFLSLYLAMKEVHNKDRAQKKTIVIRSVVPTRDIGFLPGNMEEKISVYEVPYDNACANLYARKTAYTDLKNPEIGYPKLLFSTTSFVRGITFDNAVIIIDECQNMTFHELDSIITRCGENCRIIFCGDTHQADLKNNGFENFMKVLKRMNSFSCIEFGVEDIVRSGIVREYILQKMVTYNTGSP